MILVCSISASESSNSENLLSSIAPLPAYSILLSMRVPGNPILWFGKRCINLGKGQVTVNFENGLLSVSL